MANKLQKIIYMSSAFSPVLITFTVCWWWQTGRDIHNVSKWQIALIALAIVCVIAFGFSFKYARENLPITSVKLDSISSNDMWLLGYIVSYLSPFASFAFGSYHLKVLFIIIAACCIAILFVDIKWPHPLLFVMGYHFWNIDINDAASGYILISKRKLQGPKNIHLVKRYFNSILIDAER